MIKYLVFIPIFLIGLVYILAPGPKSIYEIPGLPNSLKSDEPGDTYQNPNIAGYFSNYWRDEVISFYKEKYGTLNIWGFKIHAIRLNHPPEEAFQYIRDQQRTTYLEQLVFPLRGALFINGYEPISKEGKPFDSISVPIEKEGKYFDTKTTIRYYPAPLKNRLLIYLSIWGVITLLFYLSKKIIFGKK